MYESGRRVHSPESGEQGMREYPEYPGVSTKMLLSSHRWRGISLGGAMRKQLRVNKRTPKDVLKKEGSTPGRGQPRESRDRRICVIVSTGNRDPNQKLQHSRLEEVIKHDSE